ncbi:allene oxide cyclase barrel-like domain-containing protein [Kitasatospora sp. NPDC001683]
MVTNGNSSRYVTVKRFLAASLATAAIGLVAVGNADAGTPRKGNVEILDLMVQNDQYQAVDLGPAGPSLGDLDVYSGTTVKDGRSLGHGGGSCQVVQIDGGVITAQCLITMEVEGGSLTLQSLWTKGSSAPLDMAITGGTGSYATARGTVRFWDIGTPNERARAEIQR